MRDTFDESFNNDFESDLSSIIDMDEYIANIEQQFDTNFKLSKNN